MAGLKGKCQTVLGLVSPEELGYVLPHEHVLLNFTGSKVTPAFACCDADVKDLDLTMENLGVIRQFPYSCYQNLVVDDPKLAVAELAEYKKAGGGTLVDCTTAGIRLDPAHLVDISRDSGVKIVCGTGFYVDNFLDEDMKAMDVQERFKVMVSEITEGFTSGVKAGIIGEMGCSYPLTPHERVSLQAAALAQKETGAPLIIHPGRDPKAPLEILEVLSQEGADISHTVMSHLDRTVFTEQDLLEIARRGCYLEYDLFGIECSHYQMKVEVDMPSDAQRIQWVKFLVEQGYRDRVLIAQDIHTKHRLVKYGGHGYGHILKHVVPMMLGRGIAEEDVHKITHENPQKWLTFA